MEEEDDDDIYAPDENFGISDTGNSGTVLPHNGNVKKEDVDDEEEGEEIEEDGSDSDIDIITERKGESKNLPIQPLRTKETRLSSSKASTSEAIAAPITHQAAVVKSEPSGRDTPVKPGSSFPPIKSSNIDVDAKPIFEPAGKAITDLDMDADFPEDDKPWRRPGTDLTDYFNYGFDEFTWASYCLKQTTLRKEVTDSKKQMEEMQSFLSGGMPGMPGMPGMQGAQPGSGPQALPAMNGPTDIPPEMQQMFQQMMSQGMDPMQMDPSQFMQMMQGGQMNGSAQGFGGQGFGQQGQSQQQMGFGYGGSGGGGAGGGVGRNQGGRGQGRRW